MEITPEAFVAFEGRMVRPEARDLALELRAQPDGPRSSHGMQIGNGQSPREKADAILKRSHEEYLAEERRREKEAKRQAEAEALRQARAVEIELTPPSEHPTVKALREKQQATRGEAQRALTKAVRALEEARAQAKALEEEAAQQAARVATGDAEPAAAKRAEDEAAKAWTAVDQAESEYHSAKRAADRAQRVAAILDEPLQAAQAEAQAAFQAEGTALLRKEVEAAKAAIDEALAVNERLYKVARALRQAGVQFFDLPHYQGLLRPEVAGTRTAYAAWLEWLDTYLPQ